MRRFTLSTLSLLICTLLHAQLSADTYEDRRSALSDELADGVAVVWGRGSGEEYESAGQRSDFYYLTGIDQPDAALILLPEGKRLRSRGSILKEILYLPARDEARERWTGAKKGPGADAEKELGVDKIFEIDKIQAHIATFLRNESEIHLSAEMAGVSSPMSRDQFWIRSFQEHNPFITVRDLSPVIARMRQVKSSGELDLIRKSISLTDRAISEAMKLIEPGVYEYQVEATVEYEFRFGGGEGPCFSSIVGSGPNSTVLHYSNNNRMMKEGDLLVLDIGARYGHYCADITRTLPVSGRFSEEQAEIYNIVLEAQRRAIEKIRPGAVYREDVDSTAYQFIDDKGYGKYFIHGTGHFVGLDVHDAGDYSLPLEPGMILTVEPGIYVPEKEIGVRIEDMVLVTKNGHEVLSRNIPKARDDIEKSIRTATEARP